MIFTTCITLELSPDQLSKLILSIYGARVKLGFPSFVHSNYKCSYANYIEEYETVAQGEML